MPNEQDFRDAKKRNSELVKKMQLGASLDKKEEQEFERNRNVMSNYKMQFSEKGKENKAKPSIATRVVDGIKKVRLYGFAKKNERLSLTDKQMASRMQVYEKGNNKKGITQKVLKSIKEKSDGNSILKPLNESKEVKHIRETQPKIEKSSEMGKD